MHNGVFTKVMKRGWKLCLYKGRNRTHTMTKIHIGSAFMLTVSTALIDVIRMRLKLWHLPFQDLWPQFNHEKDIKHPQVKNILPKPWPIHLKTLKVIKNMKRLRNCHSIEHPKKLWPVNVKWYPRWKSKIEKENKQKQKKSE